MSFFHVEKATPIDTRQGWLMQLAALFLLFYSLALTLAPAARLHSWNVEYRWNHWIGFVVWLIGAAAVHRQIIHMAPDRDPYLFPVAALLAGWGLLEIWRLDSVNGTRQTIWLAVSLLVVWLGMRAPDLLGWLRRYKYLWLTGGLLLTALTFLLGTYPGGEGPRLWLGCCGVYFQPSEPLKLLLIIYLAAYLSDRLPFRFPLAAQLVPTMILAGAALGLLAAQRDLGTASLFILIYTLVVFMASGRYRMLAISGLVLLAAGILGYELFAVVRVRIDAWLNPWVDPTGSSYQIVQSILAIANGDLIGRGPGLGSPAVVPVAHSDFIFASIAEETGLLGAAALLALFALLVMRSFRVALCAPNNFRRYLASGLGVYLALQAILITGGNLRMLPLTGVTLPFVSYGGSSLLTAFISILLLVLISNREEEEPAPLPQPIPYRVAAGVLLLAFLSLSMASGWWAGIRADDLLARPDNPRWAINDRYVMRGAILDRNNTIISYTEGQPGSYERMYNYPPLAATTGYLSPRFGLAGIERSMDPYLRGQRGYPASTIWWERLLTGQTPPGLNVRLTLDMDLQRKADDLLAGHAGAVVLLNSQTGEILAISSQPSFDPTRIDEEWLQQVADSRAPLINRATQGQYPPGTALGPFLLAQFPPESKAGAQAENAPAEFAYTKDGASYTCAAQPALGQRGWAGLVANGCPGALVELTRQASPETLQALFASLGFYLPPDLPLEVASAEARPIEQVDLAAIGQGSLTVTPLQMALAAAALNDNGLRPAPQIAGSVQTTTQGWLVLPGGNAAETVLAGDTLPVTTALRHGDDRYWQALGAAQSAETRLTWLIAGTIPGSPGAPLALAVVLEEENPILARQIGETLLR